MPWGFFQASLWYSNMQTAAGKTFVGEAGGAGDLKLLQERLQ